MKDLRDDWKDPWEERKDRTKYTVLGFHQKEAVKLELTLKDLLILQWFMDWSGGDGMLQEVVNGKEYSWVKPQS